MALIGQNEAEADYGAIREQRRQEFNATIRTQLDAKIAGIGVSESQALDDARAIALNEIRAKQDIGAPDEVIRLIVQQLDQQKDEIRTNTRRAVVVAVNGAEVAMQAGPPNSCDIKGRWIGSEAPKIGQVVNYIEEGRGVPIVLGTTGQNTLGKITTFTSYTPLWTGDGGLPSLGNGHISGQYIKAEGWCWFQVMIVAGSSTTYGAGMYNISLPFQAAPLFSGEQQSVEAHLFNPGSARYRGIGVINSGAFSVQVTEPSSWASPSGFVWTATTPFTFGQGDLCEVHGLYRTA